MYTEQDYTDRRRNLTVDSKILKYLLERNREYLKHLEIERRRKLKENIGE